MTDRGGREGDRVAIELKGFAQAANREPDRVPGVEAALGPRLGARREDQDMAVVGAGPLAGGGFVEVVVGTIGLGQVGK